MRVLVLMVALMTPSWAQDEGTDSSETEDTLEGLGVEPVGAPVSGQEAEDKADEVGSKLRCPQCQGLSVSDSKADAARTMYARILELVEQGYSEEQILDYFVSRYGEGILLEPKVEGMNWLIWGGPGLALLAGLAFVGWKMAGRRREGSVTSESDAEARAELPAEEDEGLARLDAIRDVRVDDPYLDLILSEVTSRSAAP